MRLNALRKEREKLIRETRESRLILWELLRLRHPQWDLTKRLISADEISNELKQALPDWSNNRKPMFTKWQRMRLWPPPEILQDRQEQALEHQND